MDMTDGLLVITIDYEKKRISITAQNRIFMKL